jgi:hypothetical protein
MQFTHSIGIISTKAELEALIGFAKETTDANVTMRVWDGKFLAFACNGFSGVYHHGEAFDGEGGPATERRIWEIKADTLRMLKSAMDTGDELVLHVDSGCRLYQAEIREEKSSETRLRIELDGHVSELLMLPLDLPTRPDRFSPVGVSELVLGWGVLETLKKVTKAACTNAIRFCIGTSAIEKVYVEVDEIKRLSDNESARWVCILMPIDIDEAKDR